jgi:hypothetical protein
MLEDLFEADDVEGCAGEREALAGCEEHRRAGPPRNVGGGREGFDTEGIDAMCETGADEAAIATANVEDGLSSSYARDVGEIAGNKGVGLAEALPIVVARGVFETRILWGGRRPRRSGCGDDGGHSESFRSAGLPAHGQPQKGVVSPEEGVGYPGYP